MGPGNTGLDKWFDQQLHPESIDETDLNARLAQFPAMQWSTQDLLYRMPSQAMIRQAADGKINIPASGTLHAVYENQIYRYQMRKAAQADKQANAAANPNAANPSAANQARALRLTDSGHEWRSDGWRWRQRSQCDMSAERNMRAATGCADAWIGAGDERGNRPMTRVTPPNTMTPSPAATGIQSAAC